MKKLKFRKGMTWSFSIPYLAASISLLCNRLPDYNDVRTCMSLFAVSLCPSLTLMDRYGRKQI